MKKLVLTSLAIGFLAITNAQNLSYSWSNYLTRSVNTTVRDNNGDFVSIGSFSGVKDFDPTSSTYTLNASDGAMYMQKNDANGVFLWAKNFGNSNSSVSLQNAIDIKVAVNNDYIITGIFLDNADFDPSLAVATLTCEIDNSDIFLARYNDSGVYQWAFSIGGKGASNNDIVKAVTIDSNNDILITGFTPNYSPGFIDFDPSAATATPSMLGGIYIAKYNSAGNYIWSKMLPTNGTIAQEGRFIFTDANNNILLLGKTMDGTDFDPSVSTYNIPGLVNYAVSSFYAKYNSSGDFVWAKGISGGSNVEITKASASSDLSNILCTVDCAGATTDADPSPTATYTVNTHFSNFGKMIQKLDGNANLQWAYGVKKDYNTVYTDNLGNNITNIKDTIISYSNSGTINWKVRAENAMPNNTFVLPNNDIYIAGYALGNANCDPFTFTSNALYPNIGSYILKWTQGTSTFVNENINNTEIKLYPNPVRDMFHIEIVNLKANSTIAITDVLGKIVLTQPVIDTNQTIDISNLQSGVYLIRTNGVTKKIIKH
jgi:hypothetical protein